MVMLATRPDSIDINFEKSAIVVVDMQNAFVSKKGMFDLAGFDLSGAPEVIAGNQRLIETARAAGVKVI